ncbi:hypothetical protein EOK75_15110 (plasmid) [Pseudorhodobacter turbinis]|uniref:Uncharacterized protein n=1 Tax=Pseudorhodobacter turbinis TaxID=2500533 RepID=A0A4P8EK54_9RHOB|nr:hypothetical protein [Pseudorhodobacter turbinis]QCO57105.1 hypothetical protein EOK75_15110 [Pseudorhodobacter turbinis]
MFRYLLLAVALMFTGASAQAATYYFGTNDARCHDYAKVGEGYFRCQARMKVYVSPGDDGTSTNTRGGLDTYRGGERIGVV